MVSVNHHEGLCGVIGSHLPVTWIDIIYIYFGVWRDTLYGRKFPKVPVDPSLDRTNLRLNVMVTDDCNVILTTTVYKLSNNTMRSSEILVDSKPYTSYTITGVKNKNNKSDYLYHLLYIAIWILYVIRDNIFWWINHAFW